MYNIYYLHKYYKYKRKYLKLGGSDESNEIPNEIPNDIPNIVSNPNLILDNFENIFKILSDDTSNTDLNLQTEKSLLNIQFMEITNYISQNSVRNISDTIDIKTNIEQYERNLKDKHFDKALQKKQIIIGQLGDLKNKLLI